MIDLDALDSPLTPFEESYAQTNQLYVELSSWLCQNRLSYPDFQKVAKWLGAYQYVLPRDREIYPPLSDLLYSANRYNLFALALLISHLAAHLNQTQQLLLLQRLEQRPGQKMEKSPENCGTLGDDPEEMI